MAFNREAELVTEIGRLNTEYNVYNEAETSVEWVAAQPPFSVSWFHAAQNPVIGLNDQVSNTNKYVGIIQDNFIPSVGVGDCLKSYRLSPEGDMTYNDFGGEIVLRITNVIFYRTQRVLEAELVNTDFTATKVGYPAVPYLQDADDPSILYFDYVENGEEVAF